MSATNHDLTTAQREADTAVARLVATMANEIQGQVKGSTGDYQVHEGVLALSRLVAATKGVMPTEPPVKQG